MGSVEVENLSKIFDSPEGEIIAVDDLNISINDGEFIVLVGPSGCGKSTTLRCIAGLETISEGDILLNNNSITNKKAKNRDMAMVFQNYALYPHMTARENIGFGLKMSTDMSSTEINNRVENVAKNMGISDLLDKKPSDLSGGQQQRVALGRAIVREPAVFLMDEPLSNLDAKLRTQMRTELRDLQQNLGITTLYVTHNQIEAMTMGDRIAILNEGHLQQLGTPLECYHNPNNLFVAGFIGSPSMNFINVEREGDKLVGGEFTYQISPSLAEELSTANKDLIIGIRPEDILLTRETTPNTITTTVEITEPTGEVTYIYFKLNDETYIISVDGETVIENGDQIRFQFPEERLHIFDEETGEAIKNRVLPDKSSNNIEAAILDDPDQ